MTDKFVHRLNIEHFRTLLAGLLDGQTRQQVQKLLDEELAKDQLPMDEDGHRPPETEA